MKIIETSLIRIWNDPVGSKVIAWCICGIIGLVITTIYFALSPSSCTPNKPHTVVAKQTPLPYSNQQRYEKPVPKRDENDVLIPLIILQSITGFDESKTVYAATYKNNWLNIPNPENEAKVIEDSIMKRKGNDWRAINLAGTRFQPVQLINSNLSEKKFNPSNISWPLIEDLHKVYGDTWEKFSKEFLDNQESCFLIP